MVTNLTLQKIRNGEPAFGLACATGDPIMVEFIARAGFDWIWVETQHGYWSYDRMLQGIQIINATPTTPIVRVAENNFGLINRALDAGGLGVIVPMVNTPEQARQAIFSARYAPRGGRSSGGGRTLLAYGDDYHYAGANDNILLAVMIETVEALERVEEIAAVPDLDCIFIGPADLALSMGVKPLGPEHEAALQRILDAATAAGLPAGFPCASVEDALRRVEQGFRLVHCGSELGMVRAGLKATLQALGRA